MCCLIPYIELKTDQIIVENFNMIPSVYTVKETLTLSVAFNELKV